MSKVSLINPGAIINLHILADAFLLDSPQFHVLDVMEGGMGTCAKIESNDGHVFALKIPHSDAYINQNKRARSIEEMKTWLSLSAFPGVVPALCIDSVNDVPCIISKWMSNGNLKKTIKGKPIQLQFFMTMDRLIQTLDALYRKHRIIHRDLKPENILLDENLLAFIGDWGISKEIVTTESPQVDERQSQNNNVRRIRTEGAIGTVTYASPEQLLGKSDIDFRSDIYSLGCIMYEWETGRVPFMGKTWEDIAEGHIYRSPDSIKGSPNTLFKAEQIILRCLEKNPDDRYQSYDELHSDLMKVAKREFGYEGAYLGEIKESFKYGQDSHTDYVKKHGIMGKHTSEGTYYLMDDSKAASLINEGIALLGLREFDKAVLLFKQFYVRELFEKSPNSHFVQLVTVNYAQALFGLGKTADALDIIQTINEANPLPASYYCEKQIFLQQFSEI